MTHPVYSVHDLKYSYKMGNTLVQALNGVSLTIAPNELVCLSGPSGSGKSTLLSILGLIEPLQTGIVTFDNRDFSKLTEAEKNAIRRHQIGFIFQRFHLFPVLNAQENVEFFLSRQGVQKEERKALALEALKSVGLEEYRHKRPLEMSGGQQQRVAIARALAKRPKVIIADELTASLDQKNGREIMGLLKKLCSEQGVTVVVASHDPMVFEFADKLVRIKNGEIE